MGLRLSYVITRRNPIPFAMMLAACWTRSGCLATHGNRVDMADQNGALPWRSFHRVLETEVSYGGTPKWMVYNGNSMEFLLRLMIWVYHHFRKPPNKWMKIVSGDREDSSTVSLVLFGYSSQPWIIQHFSWYKALVTAKLPAVGAFGWHVHAQTLLAGFCKGLYLDLN